MSETGNIKIPELNAAVGSREAMEAAIHAGADAVCVGLTTFNSRMTGANFGYPQAEGAVKSLRRKGKKIYFLVDTVFEQREADRVYQLLKYLAALEPDGLELQDFGLAAMAREHFPSFKLHASCRMNIACARGIHLLSRYGFSRAALAGELSLDEIRKIREASNVELEVFVHGPFCICEPGLCLFSSYLGGKSENRGLCAQACRRLYRPLDAAGVPAGLPVEGGFYFGSEDLRLAEKVPELAAAGVNALRIECRRKSAEYAGDAVLEYRRLLDGLVPGGEPTGGRRGRYAPLLPKDLSGFKRVPGRDKAPPPVLPQAKNAAPGGRGQKAQNGDLPEGLYVQVSRIEDLYILQSKRPVKAMINYHHGLLSRLLGNEKQPLPFSPACIIPVLDPFFPQSLEAELADDTAALLKKGYRTFVVNNPGHFSLLRNSGAVLIAGPWLYVFNRWALAFVLGCGADWLVSPLENNRQNLERTLPRNASGQGGRSQVFINVYSRPSLFRIRRGNGATEGGAGYNLEIFSDRKVSDRKISDSRGEEFTLARGPSAGSALVYPEKPFYIGDKIPFLKGAGFSRFILDFSDRPVKKGEYRDIINAVENAAHLGGSERFNWKDGFFRPEEKLNGPL